MRRQPNKVCVVALLEVTRVVDDSKERVGKIVVVGRQTVGRVTIGGAINTVLGHRVRQKRVEVHFAGEAGEEGAVTVR